MEIMIFTSSNLLIIIFLTRVLSHSAVSLPEQEQLKRSKVIKSNKLIGVYISICDRLLLIGTPVSVIRLLLIDTSVFVIRLLLIGTPVFVTGYY